MKKICIPEWLQFEGLCGNLLEALEKLVPHQDKQVFHNIFHNRLEEGHQSHLHEDP